MVMAVMMNSKRSYRIKTNELTASPLTLAMGCQMECNETLGGSYAASSLIDDDSEEKVEWDRFKRAKLSGTN